ncbi:hypothetical protein AeMF1_000485 [Aphanomyces euteiches]|nr:hypothetical protein AeMF1_000485 [Aphanomyces euteiches]
MEDGLHGVDSESSASVWALTMDHTMPSTKQSELEKVSLPAELIHRIVFYIEDANDLFCLLETLRPSYHLGLFEHLWQLSLAKNRSELWPKLAITRKDASLADESLALLEAFAKNYTQVQIAYANLPILNDIAWIAKYVDPMATQEWQINACASEEYLNQLVQLRIVSLQPSRFFTNGAIMNILPRLQYLTRLVIVVSDVWMDEILDFAANSRQLVELILSAPLNTFTRIAMTNTSLTDATKWLYRQPVREFQFDHWDLRAADQDVRQKFCEAVFNCPSLSKLTCKDSLFDLIDPSKFLFTMPSLTIFNCFSHEGDSFDLSSQLIGSGVINLAYGSHGFDSDRALVRIFEILPQSLIKQLELTQLRLKEECWEKVMGPIRHCSLDSLILRNFDISTHQLNSLAQAIRSNNSIVDLAIEYINTTHFNAEDAMLLIECVTDPSRAVKLRSIKIRSDKLAEKMCPALRSFAETRGVQHITILHR